MTSFTHLHTHTNFSILDSLISVKDLFARIKELGQTSVAISDHGSLGSAWLAHKASKAAGIKLIIGSEMYFVDSVEKTDDRFRHIILLAKNAEGYKNLLSLQKEGFNHGATFTKRIFPLIDWKLLEQYHEGLICLTSCSSGIIAQLLMQKKMNEAEEQLLRLHKIFGEDLGVEIQANTLKRNATAYNDAIEQLFVNNHLIKLGKKHNIKIVATSNAHYCRKDDAEAHDVLLAVGARQPKYSNFRLRYDCPDFYLKSGDEIKAFFSRNYGEEFAEEVCANSIFFADRCEKSDFIDPKSSNPSGKELPEFPCNDELDYSEFQEWQKDRKQSILDLDEDKQFLRYRCEKSFIRMVPSDKIAEYRARLEEELDVLYFCGVSSYMLIVQDYVSWCLQNEVAVGPGRGSCGGSLVAYLLGIHQADPIKYGLVFARFFNKLKSSYADIDLDFSKDKRHLVLEYIIKKYGKDHVAAISNIIGMKPKVYVRDIARACELGGSKEAAVELGNNLSDCITAETKNIDDALENFPLFAEYAIKYPEIKKFKTICNMPRSVGMHAAGLIISKRPVHHIVPVRKDRDGMTLIEYDKDMAEENGLVKMDILGLSTLDIIDNTNQLIRENGKEVPTIDYGIYDEKTYNLISKGDTFGVFQFGTSAGTIDLCRKIKPKSLEELAIITTLARPAAKDLREDFIKTRDGKKKVALYHPLLKRAFEGTYGFPLYDESLLILAKDVAGWELDDADKLRKLTKEKGKSPEKVEGWRKDFIAGCIKNGLQEVIAEKIWENIVLPYSRYSFCKSHAILYSMISFHTAYLKAHFPIEFLLANLLDEVRSNAPTADANIERIKNEIRSHHVKIIPPDLNKSELRYVMQENKLITGLDALKYVSDEAIEDIISKRPFSSFQDFMSRISSKLVRSNTIQALAGAGCFDSFGIPRHLIHLYVSDYRKKITVWMKKHNSKEEEFFYPWPVEEEWTRSQLYANEQFYLGEGFSCLKKEAYGNFFNDRSMVGIQAIRKMDNKSYVDNIRGIVISAFTFRVKKADSKYVGMEMAKVLLEDANGDQCSLTIFPDRWILMQERIKELFKGKVKFEPGIALHFSGSSNLYEDAIGVILDKVFSVAPIPQRPLDLKPKRINLKSIKSEQRVKEEKIKEYQDPMDLYNAIEDWAFDEGLIDLDNEEDNV